MENHAANSVTYYLLVDVSQNNAIYSLRQWDNLKIAYDSNNAWIKGFSKDQIHSSELKKIPNAKIFFSDNNKLFPLHSRLPYCTEPALFWSPIHRALPVHLPAVNHNFFGVNKHIQIALKESTVEKNSDAILTNKFTLEKYILNAPKIRLHNLDWIIINHDQVMIFGYPCLPLDGKTYWKYNSFYIPTGYTLQWINAYPFLNKNLNPKDTHWVVFDNDNSFFLIGKNEPTPLSIASFRISNTI